MVRPVSRFFWPTVRILPLDIEGDLTDYEFLLKLCTKMSEIIDALQVLPGMQEAIKELQEDVISIMEELEKVKNGDYVSLYLDSIINYINNNLKELVGDIVKFVVFGLSQDGHFVAMIPDTWNFIHWDTIMDYNSPLYGHLVMRW